MLRQITEISQIITLGTNKTTLPYCLFRAFLMYLCSFPVTLDLHNFAYDYHIISDTLHRRGYEHFSMFTMKCDKRLFILSHCPNILSNFQQSNVNITLKFFPLERKLNLMSFSILANAYLGSLLSSSGWLLSSSRQLLFRYICSLRIIAGKFQEVKVVVTHVPELPV